MVNTTSPDFNKLLDTLLEGQERRLLLLKGHTGGYMLTFTESGIDFLETQLIEAEANLKNLKKAIALSRVGIALGADFVEEE